MEGLGVVGEENSLEICLALLRKSLEIVDNRL